MKRGAGGPAPSDRVGDLGGLADELEALEQGGERSSGQGAELGDVVPAT
jgi:hypothetical protein